VVPLELPSYSKKENWGASETFYQTVRTLLADRAASFRAAGGSAATPRPEGVRPRANILGPTLLGFRCRDDIVEIAGLLDKLGIEVNVIAPLGASPDDLRRLPDADFNIDLYPEIARTTASWLQRSFGMPFTKAIPMGIGATRDFIREVAALAGVDAERLLQHERPGIARRNASASRAQWYSRSVDSTYLTGKRVFIFGDATHAIAAARVAAEEMGFTVVGLGTYSREFARDVREAAQKYQLEALIADDYLEVENAIAAATPELVLGTQMERHIAKRLGIPCAVISSPIHVQDVPARYSPVYGFEGANVLFDSWVHPLMMGLEEHLLQMFRDDFEFNDAAPPSHIGSGVTPIREMEAAPIETASVATIAIANTGAVAWATDAEAELRKVPFFVRNKARRNTERYAVEHGLATVTVETLYDAKAHFGR
jgi:light-independent protochlorophyllide reductase subunit B